MTTLPVIWVMMGLRFRGAGQDEEGKWLPYGAPYQTKEECLAAKVEALNEPIHRSFLDCIPFKAIKRPPSNPGKYCEKHQDWCTSERDRQPNVKE